MVFIFPFPNFSAELSFKRWWEGKAQPSGLVLSSSPPYRHPSLDASIVLVPGLAAEAGAAQANVLAPMEGAHAACVAPQWPSAGASFTDERELPCLEGCCETNLCKEPCEYRVKHCLRDLRHRQTRTVSHITFPIIFLLQTVLPLSCLPLFFSCSPVLLT